MCADYRHDRPTTCNLMGIDVAVLAAGGDDVRIQPTAASVA